MDDKIETTLRQAAGIVAENMIKAYQETDEMSLNVKLSGDVAKRMAALCTMMETAYGTTQEEMCEYVIALGLQNLQQGKENESA